MEFVLEFVLQFVLELVLEFVLEFGLHVLCTSGCSSVDHTVRMNA